MFFKLLCVLLGAAIGGVAYIHYSGGEMHQQFDPMIMDAIAKIKDWMPVKMGQ